MDRYDIAIERKGEIKTRNHEEIPGYLIYQLIWFRGAVWRLG